MNKRYDGIDVSHLDDDVLLDEAVSLARETPAEVAARDDDDQAWAGTVRAEVERRGLGDRLDELVATLNEADHLSYRP